MSSCQRCKQTSSGPQAFLLTCRGCRKTWHHRCHMPPVEDTELIKLIRATTAGDTANDLSTWMCRRCRKGTSATPSTRETTTTTDSRENTKSSTAAARCTTSVAPTAKATRVKELTIPVGTRLVNDSKSERQESTEAVPAKQPPVDKQPKLSVADNESRVQPPPAVRFTKVTLQEQTVTSKRTGAARKQPDAASTTFTDGHAEMQVDPPTATSRIAARAPQAPSLAMPEPVAPGVRIVSSSNEHQRPADGAVNPPRVTRDVIDDDVDDDPDDLYGPPVERRIIRILPSLAEELREQQRRVAAEKEKRRAPLAPDWILERHVNDPLWKVQENRPEGRKRRKQTAQKLGGNGVNVAELMGNFTARNWIREHRM